MADTASSVQSHYAAEDLVGRILSVLQGEGYDTDTLSVETLNLTDQLHDGGLGATQAQADLAGISEGLRVLDAGCGIGGAARYLAHTHGCQVEAIDLTREFVDAAIALTELCGLSDKITFRQGSVTDLPYDDQSFDLVWSQNVSMNVEDKAKLFAEAYRVLLPGGRLVFSHVTAGPGGEPYYPLPWARRADYSFLGSEEEILERLAGAGFRILEKRNEINAPGGGRQPKPLAGSVVMGADMRERAINSKRSAEEQRTKDMLVLAERPA